MPVSAQAGAGFRPPIVVENVGPVWTAGGGIWRLAAAPGLVIGATAGDQRAFLFDTRAAGRLGDGSVVVLHGTELRIFDRMGRHRITSGRRGQAPGEFPSGPTGLTILRGDTIAVTVGFPFSALLFAPDGAYVTTERIPLQPRRALTDLIVSHHAMLRDGTRVLRLDRALESGVPPGMVRPDAAVIRINRESGGADTLLWTKGGEQLNTGTAARPSFEIPPFARRLFIAAVGDRIYVAENGVFEFHAFSTSGERPMIIRARSDPEPVTDRDKDMYLARQARMRAQAMSRIAGIPNVDPERLRVELREAQRRRAITRWPATKPFFDGLIADRVGNLWVIHDTPEGTSGRADVFARDGRWLGPVDLPPGGRVLEIGADYLLGVWADPDDNQFLRLYALLKGS